MVFGSFGWQQTREIAYRFCHLLERAPTMVCEVQSVGGTKELTRERARKSAERALA